MRKSLFITAVLIVAGLLFSGWKISNTDSLSLTKTEPSIFLDEEVIVLSDQFGILEENRDFDTAIQDAAASGLSPEDVQFIRELLADSFSMKTAEIKITVERESTADFATGYVNIGEGDKGGIYFAARTDGGWKIAHNGTGVVECALANSYNFPVGLIPRCFDRETGLNVDR